MKIVAISCTHGQHKDLELPKGDLLIHCGDNEIRNKKDLKKLNEWFGAQDFKYKIIIAGNHDIYLEKKEKSEIQEMFTNAEYLEDDWAYVEGIKIYGSPRTPRFGNWAFMADRGNSINRYWKEIPEDVDILVTHGPQYGLLDETFNGELVGCYDLGRAIERIKPRYHIFGHIHESYGVAVGGPTTSFNCCILDEWHNIANKPVVFEYY